MKRFLSAFLISFYLIFNTVGLRYAFSQSNIYAQGIYTLSDFNISKTSTFAIQNVSRTDHMYLFVFDENLGVVELLRLPPNSPKVDTVPIDPDDIILLIGKGEIYLTPINS